MTVLRNEGRWDTSNAVYATGLVTAYDKGRPHPRLHWIDYGLGGLAAGALKDAVPAEEQDLSTLYHRLARANELCGYEAKDRFFEIGTPVALAETDSFLRRFGRSGPAQSSC